MGHRHAGRPARPPPVPHAPPRGLEGFTDTIREAGLDLDSGWVALLYNPLAAMPSIHMAYAEVTSAGIASTARSPRLRGAARAYPPAVALSWWQPRTTFSSTCSQEASWGAPAWSWPGAAASFR
jgi:hypothetical protein